MNFMYYAIIMMNLSGSCLYAQDDRDNTIAWYKKAFYTLTGTMLVPPGVGLAASGLSDFAVTRLHPEAYAKAGKKFALGATLLTVGLMNLKIGE